MNNIRLNDDEEQYFSIEDIMSYSNIEITHVNDNKTPIRIIAFKVVVWLLIIALIAGLFFL